MNKLIFAARTREALKSYTQLHNLNPNNYVLVEVPDAIRQNKVVKSLAQNITNPDVKYVMIHKSCVTVNRNGVPSLNVAKLSENSYASSLNKPESEQIGEKTVGKGGVLKSVISDIEHSNLSPKLKSAAFQVVKSFVAAQRKPTLKSVLSDIYNSNLNNAGKNAAFQVVKSFVAAQKRSSFNSIVKSAVMDIERSNLGSKEKVAALKSVEAVVRQNAPKPVTVNTALKSMLSDLNQSNLPLNIKNVLTNLVESRMKPRVSLKSVVADLDNSNIPAKIKNLLFSVLKSYVETKSASRSEKVGPEFVSIKNMDMAASDMTMKAKKDDKKKAVIKSLFDQRDLVQENKELLKSLGSLSEEEGVFKNLHMARRYARLFNEKIASPNQRAEVVSPSIKDVQRFGKRVKARVNLV